MCTESLTAKGYLASSMTRGIFYGKQDMDKILSVQNLVACANCLEK